MSASAAFTINPSCRGKQFDIDYGYQCTLNLPEALLHVWFFCQYFSPDMLDLQSQSLCWLQQAEKSETYCMSGICVYNFI